MNPPRHPTKPVLHTKPTKSPETVSVRKTLGAIQLGGDHTPGDLSPCFSSSSWANTPDQVKVVYLGEADPSVPFGIVRSSYHAG